MLASYLFPLVRLVAAFACGWVVCALVNGNAGRAQLLRRVVPSEAAMKRLREREQSIIAWIVDLNLALGTLSAARSMASDAEINAACGYDVAKTCRGVRMARDAAVGRLTDAVERLRSKVDEGRGALDASAARVDGTLERNGSSEASAAT
jgi:hypothetical protein